jgi:ABC-type dipeptide/oligopeptide/nickel transport system permease component
VSRIAELGLTFLVITLLTFALSRAAPGDPYVGDAQSGVASDATIAEWRELRGQDEPLWTQYGRWLAASLSLDFGRSFIDTRPVRELLGEALGSTLVIAGSAALLTYALAVPLGVYLALSRRRRLASVLDNVLFVLHGVPVFWGALMLGLVVSGWGLLPVRGSFILPILCLTYPGLARIARYQKVATREVAGTAPVLLARAKGLPNALVVRRYVLRAALTAPLALLAAELPWLLGGSVVVERIFTVRGMGMLTFDAILRRDVPVIMGATAVVAIVALTSSLLADVVHAWLDPRLRGT